MVENSLVDDCSFDWVDRLCTFYSDLFDVDNFKKPTKHKTQHHIRTSGPPCVAKVRKLSPEKLEILGTELDKLLQLGIIYRSESEWASPVHLVQKKGGGWRITGDYRQLNAKPYQTATPFPVYLTLCVIWKAQPFSQALTCTKVTIKWKSPQKINAKRVSLRRWATLHFDASPWESLAQPTLFNVSCMKFFKEFLMSFASLTISSSSVGTRRSISDSYNWSLNAYPNKA